MFVKNISLNFLIPLSSSEGGRIIAIVKNFIKSLQIRIIRPEQYHRSNTINIPLPSFHCKFHFASIDSIADYASRLGVMQHHLHLSELTRRIRSSRYRYQFVSIKKNREIIRIFNDRRRRQGREESPRVSALDFSIPIASIK